MPSASPQDIGIVILAAGSSRRFKGDKRQALLSNGTGLLEATLARVPDSFSKKILVLHEGDQKLAEQFSSEWTICISRDAQQGMGHSLATAIHVQDKCRGLIIGLGDMPFIRPETYSALQLLLCSKEIVIPIFEGKRGNPVGFQAKHFPELSRLRGDKGARILLEKYNSACHRFNTDDPGILKDIDTVEAIEEAY